MKENECLKKLRFGMGSLLMTTAVIFVVVLVNYVFGEVEDRFAWTLDLSVNRQYSISEETRKVVEALNEDVHIYTLYSESTSSGQRQMMEEILKRYEALGRVRTQNLDMLANPASVSRFRAEDTQLAANSIIVANADESRFRIIPQSELYDYEVDYQTQTYTKYDFVGEQAVTSAIVYVTSQDTPVVYFLQGHDEMPLSQMRHVTDALQARNYEPKGLYLSDADADLKTGDVLIAVAPAQDLSETEYEILKTFMANGGRLYYASNYVSGALPYFDMLLSLYGVEVDKGLLIEDVGYVEYYYRNQLYLMPDIHTKPEEEQMNAAAGFEKDDYVVLPQSQAVRMTEMREMGTQYESILTTSPKAYIKSVMTQTTTLDREKQDETGAFPMAVAMKKSMASGGDIRLFVIGNALFMMDDSLFTAYDNDKLLFSPLQWLSGEGSVVQVPAKSMGSYVLRMPNNTVYHVLTATVIGVIPAVVLIAGMIVWRRRRHL